MGAFIPKGSIAKALPAINKIQLKQVQIIEGDGDPNDLPVVAQDGSIFMSKTAGRVYFKSSTVWVDNTQALADFIATKGQPNGIAPLDVNGKVAESYLPSSIVGALKFKGTWDASTNAPALASGVGSNGDIYIVSIAGATDLDGITDWNIGDWAVFNSTAWQQIDNTDMVISVNGKSGVVVLDHADLANIVGGNTHLTNAEYLELVQAQANLDYEVDGTVKAKTANYETLVTDPQDITNKKYVDDKASLEAEIAKGTRLVSASIATITDGGLTVTSPAYKAHIVDHATNTLTVAEKTTPTVLTPPDYTTPIWFAYVTAANTIQWEATEIGVPANRTLVPIFSALTNGTAIVALNNGTRGSYRDFNGFIQDFALAYPPKSIEGNVMTFTDFPNAAGCLVNKTEGKIFVPGGNVVGNTSGSEGAVPSANYLPYPSIINDMQGAGGVGFISYPSARLSGALYDVNGVSTSVGNNNWTIRPQFVGQGNLVVSPLGQFRYTSLINARNALGAESNKVNPNLNGLMLTGWVLCRGNNQEFVFVANANNYGAGTPSVSLNLWSMRTLTNADSPFTITGSKTIYVLDTSAGNIDLVLPTIDSGIASDENRFVKAADANRVKVTVNGGVQTIADKAEQYIWENGGAFSVVASDTLTYLVTQDNRKEDTFQTPTYVWGKTGSIETYDASGSTLGTGATVTGDNHSTTITTGTTVSSIGFASVATQEKIKDKNFFKFQYSASHSSEFQIVAQGWNGSAWVDVSASVLPIEAGNEVDGLIGFNKSTYTAFRVVVSNLTANAGRTFTLSRGEWTDRFSELVEVKNDSISSKVYSSTSLGSTNTMVMTFINGDINVENDLYKIETSAALGTVLTVKKRCLIGSGLTGGAVPANTVGILKNAITTAYPDAQTKSNILALNTAASAYHKASCSHSAIEFVAGDKLYPMSGNAPQDANYVTCVWTITATPLGSSKGYVYQADFDRSEFEWPSYDQSEVTITADVGGWSVTRGTFIYYKTPNGDHRLKGNLRGGCNSVSRSSASITLAGTTFKNVVSYKQPVSCEIWGVNGNEASTKPGTGAIEVSHEATATTGYSLTFDVELESMPTWATKSVKPFPMNIVGPVAVANYVSAELTGYAGGASGTVGNIQFENATNALPDYLEISANKDRVTFKKAVKNVSAQGSYACTTAVAPKPMLRLYNSSGVVRFEDYDAQTVDQSESKGVTLLFDANEGDYILLYKGTTAGTPLNSDATRLFVKCLDIDSALIASPAKDAHKNATYLSSTETPAGWCEFTGKQIWKKSFRLAAVPSGTIIDSELTNAKILPVNSWARGTNGHWYRTIAYDPTGGHFSLQVTAYGLVTTVAAAYYDKALNFTVEYIKL